MTAILVTLIAIVAIAGLEGYALSQGINGTGLAGGIAVIAGLGGYQASRIVKKKPPAQKPPD